MWGFFGNPNRVRCCVRQNSIFAVFKLRLKVFAIFPNQRHSRMHSSCRCDKKLLVWGTFSDTVFQKEVNINNAVRQETFAFRSLKSFRFNKYHTSIYIFASTNHTRGVQNKEHERTRKYHENILVFWWRVPLRYGKNAFPRASKYAQITNLRIFENSNYLMTLKYLRSSGIFR